MKNLMETLRPSRGGLGGCLLSLPPRDLLVLVNQEDLHQSLPSGPNGAPGGSPSPPTPGKRLVVVDQDPAPSGDLQVVVVD